MSPFHTAVLSGSHKLVPKNGCPSLKGMIVCVCVREGEKGRELIKNSEREMKNVIVLLGHSKRKRECMCMCVYV